MSWGADGGGRGGQGGSGGGWKNGGVPPRWLKCPRKAENFIAEKFMVFKTPLSSKYNDYVPVQYRFPPQMIMDHMKMKQVLSRVEFAVILHHMH